MYVYVSVYVLTMIFSFAYAKNSKERAKKAYTFLCLVILVLSIRCGLEAIPDAQNYYLNLMELKGMTWKNVIKEMKRPGSFEPGYMVFVKLLSYITGDIRIYITIKDLVIFTGYFIWIYKESKFPIMSLGVFIAIGKWAIAIAGFRQEIATLFLLISIKYIKERKPVKFMVLVIVATLFHRTAVSFFPAYIICNFERKYIGTLTIILLIGAGILYFFGGSIFMFLGKYARIFYVAVEEGGLTTFLVFWSILLFVQLFLRSMLKLREVRIYYLLFLIAAVLQSISLRASLWARVVIYFSLALIILIPDMLCYIVSISRRNNTRVMVSFVFEFVLLLWCCYIHLDRVFTLV